MSDTIPLNVHESCPTRLQFAIFILKYLIGRDKNYDHNKFHTSLLLFISLLRLLWYAVYLGTAVTIDVRLGKCVERCKLRLRDDFLTLVCRGVVRKGRVIFVLEGKTGSVSGTSVRGECRCSGIIWKDVWTSFNRHFIGEVCAPVVY